VTIAATLATAPLMAHDFEAVPAASLPANLMALPAVAPAMWLGMLASIAGQVPGLPVEPFNWLDSLLLAYIAQVAHWWAAPSWALVPLRLGSWPAVAGAYAMLALGLATASALVHRRVALTPGMPLRRGRRGAALALAACCCLGLGLLIAGGAAGAGAPTPRTGLRLELLDVGQGDAILLRPADGLPILVDGGPHGDDLRGILAGQGVDRLAAAVVTHDQADHAGGIEDILGAVPMQTLVYGDPSPPLLRAASAAGIGAVHVAEGSEVRSGSLRLEVLWPPRGEPAAPGADPNLHAIVAVARWQGFSALLTADAEAESVPVDPGPVDVLKVAHHGSADAGLDGLLDRSGPRLALISVGAGNSYGHPTAETLAKLARHHVPVARTDLDGTVEIDVGDGGWTVKRSH
jgi:competence protein ComEC